MNKLLKEPLVYLLGMDSGANSNYRIKDHSLWRKIFQRRSQHILLTEELAVLLSNALQESKQ